MAYFTYNTIISFAFPGFNEFTELNQLVKLTRFTIPIVSEEESGHWVHPFRDWFKQHLSETCMAPFITFH